MTPRPDSPGHSEEAHYRKDDREHPYKKDHKDEPVTHESGDDQAQKHEPKEKDTPHPNHPEHNDPIPRPAPEHDKGQPKAPEQVGCLWGFVRYVVSTPLRVAQAVRRFFVRIFRVK